MPEWHVQSDSSARWRLQWLSSTSSQEGFTRYRDCSGNLWKTKVFQMRQSSTRLLKATCREVCRITGHLYEGIMNTVLISVAFWKSLNSPHDINDYGALSNTFTYVWSKLTNLTTIHLSSLDVFYILKVLLPYSRGNAECMNKKAYVRSLFIGQIVLSVSHVRPNRELAFDSLLLHKFFTIIQSLFAHEQTWSLLCIRQSLKHFGPGELKGWYNCNNAPQVKIFSPNYLFDKETKIIIQVLRA